MSSQPHDVLIFRDEDGIIDRVRKDPAFTWRDQYAVNDFIGHVCVNWRDHPKGAASMAGLPSHLRVVQADHLVAVSYQILRPTVYAQKIAGFYLLDVSII